MSVNPIGFSPAAINAYRAAMGQGQALGGVVPQTGQGGAGSFASRLEQAGGAMSARGGQAAGNASGTGFVDSIKKSLSGVNAEQTKKDQMVQSFATGENQNVHELMIQLQKAGVAMSMTSAVRGKVMDMYRELVKMPF
jgi:flagellar hook-basal body complex protein FliE